MRSVPRLRCFDLDGCVVVSDEAIADGLHHAARVVGLPRPDAPTVRAAIGPPLVVTFRALLRSDGVDPESTEGVERLASAIAAYRTRYAEVGFGLTRPVPGIVPLLERLASRMEGSTVIVTAKPATVAVPLLEHVGLSGYFDAVHGVPLGLDVEGKEVTLARALATSATEADDAVMIGDRASDVRAGRACGTRTVGVLWGAGDRAELQGAGADAVLTRPEQLAPFLVAP